jgi:hypothetical protein
MRLQRLGEMLGPARGVFVGRALVVLASMLYPVGNQIGERLAAGLWLGLRLDPLLAETEAVLDPL